MYVAGPSNRQFVPSDFPDRIKRLREKLGLTQAELAELLGVSFVSVNRWENGKSRISSLAWQQIAAAEKTGLSVFHAQAVPSSESPTEQTPSSEIEAPSIPQTDFCADPELVRLFVEGERLKYGYLYNPAFATELSSIDPLPHQRLAVYESMLPQSRLRFLLADDAGAGKTIMAGLYIREMLSRRLVQRVLIVPPAGLLGNWRREMQLLFRLPFRIVIGSEAKTRNPFLGPSSNLVIVSIDTLAGDRMFSRLQESTVAPYDLVIFDEAHKLSADREPDFTVRKTDRYKLAEALAGARGTDPRWDLSWAAQHLLLLTATPHMGKDFPYYCLWRLLEPEVLPTFEAFSGYPVDARRRHFIRRTKEEMVRYDESPLYPTRVSDTLSYELTQGRLSEQTLYDETTQYIRSFYNRARILNRSAARFAMMIFQRRLASSTYALLESLKRRLSKLDGIIEDIESGRLSIEQMHALQRKLDRVTDPFDSMTADEENAEGDREENQTLEDQVLGGIVAASLAELQAERRQVEELVALAQRVYENGDESKFERLRTILQDPRYKNEKLIIFTEHRDTLNFIVRRLEGLGFTGQVATVHGGMDYREREQQVEFFRKPVSEGGARFLVGTDAAGEGINLQFCWLMVNYDIPWNPARLEQRMGRIHRYGQKHDPVIILNLVAGKTREGRVLKTLLDKLERIRKELGSDKVFDVVGRMFMGVSLTEYMEEALTESGADAASRKIDGTLTKEQVKALEERERRLFGDGGDVRKELPRLRNYLDQELYRRLLPGYVRRFIEKAAPLIEVGIAGDLDGFFGLKALAPHALDSFLPILEMYPKELRDRLTVFKPDDPSEAIFVHPGEPVFDGIYQSACSRTSDAALRGAVFVDSSAERPYLFHLALVAVTRRTDPSLPAFSANEVLEYKLVGIRQEENGKITESPLEWLLLLKGGRNSTELSRHFGLLASSSLGLVKSYGVEGVAQPMAQKLRQALLDTLPEREIFLRRGYDYQNAELAAARSRNTEKALAGDPRAKAELTKIKEQQRSLSARLDQALNTLRREPELVGPEEPILPAHALVVPSDDPVDKRRRDDEIEALAVRVAWAYEEAKGAQVQDVSTPDKARAAGLSEHPGFDLRSVRPDGEVRNIEVKGRASIGDVEISENEWVKACNLREKYWLYAVFNCATPHPHLERVQDPFAALLVRAKGGVTIDEKEIFQAAEKDS